MDRRISLIIMAAASVLMSGCASSVQENQDKGPVYVEAKEWDKQHPDRPVWKMYPSLTVDSLGIRPEKADRLNGYGSLAKGPSFKATGYFYTTEYNDRWIFVDPEGHAHIDAAVVGVRTGQGERNKAAWNSTFKTSA